MELEPSAMEAGAQREGWGRGGTNQPTGGRAIPPTTAPPSPGMGSCDCPREAELGARRYPGYRLAAWKGARSVVRKLGDGKRALV